MLTDDFERRIAEATQQDTDHSLAPNTKKGEFKISTKKERTVFLKV